MKEIQNILKPKEISRILGISQSGVYSKLKRENGNKFSEEDLNKIKEYVKRLL